MKYAEMSGLAAKEIQKKLTQLETDMFEASMKNSLGQLANPMEIRSHRRDIARLKTALTAKAGKAPLSKANREDRKAAGAKAAKTATAATPAKATAPQAKSKSAAKTKAAKGTK